MLTTKQARENQEKYGFNELVEGKKKSIMQIFLEQFKDFLVIILIISAVISGILGDAESAIVIFVVITMNAILGTVQTVKAEQSLNSLKQLSAPEAKVARDGNIIQIPSREVTIGDEVILEAGDCIPADGKLIECASLKVDESALTGESIAVEKNLDEVAVGTALGDQTNKVFSGSFVTYGRGRYEVTAIGMNTEVGKIADLMKNTSEKRTPLQVNLDDFGKKLSILILVFSGIIFGVNVFQGESIGSAFMFAVALAVAAIPEALSSIVTIVLSFGTQKMAKEHVNEKRIPAGKINLKNENEKLLLRFSILCNDSTNTDGQEIGDPTETALINLGSNLGIEIMQVRERYPRLSEVPFDSERKLMSTAHRIQDDKMLTADHIMIVKGAVDVLLDRMDRIRVGNTVRKMTDSDCKNISMQNMQFSREGLRVLAFAYKHLEEEKEIGTEDEEHLIFIGMIAMMDPPREESQVAVAECLNAGIRPIMITGDHKVTAAAIAKRIGILKDESEACEGADIENMSDEDLKDFVEGISVYARVSPEHKIRIVRAWQEKENIVAMTGDGVNDAPALKQADIGVAMGVTGSEVAKDAAAMVLTDDNFATIVKAVENGRNLYQHIKNAIQFLLSGNFGAILAVLYAATAGLPVPFAPVHLLFINLLTDSLPAIALGMEPHSKAVMDQKPRPVNESILTKAYLVNIGTEGLCIGIMTMAAFLIGYRGQGAVLASTMAFGTLCMSRLVHGFNCKDDKPVIFSKRFFNNKYLIGAFVLGTVLITGVLTIPGLHAMFKVVTLNMTQLMTVYGLAFLNLPVIQGLKYLKGKTKWN